MSDPSFCPLVSSGNNHYYFFDGRIVTCCQEIKTQRRRLFQQTAEFQVAIAVDAGICVLPFLYSLINLEMILSSSWDA